METTAERRIVDADLCEKITAIDPGNRNSYYPIGKLDAHINNVPHLAISIFIFQDNRLLLQKRADTKYHSGGLWANTVCSHPRWQESAQQCAERRLQEELGWTTTLREFGVINYAAQVGSLFENEQVYCFTGQLENGVDIAGFNRAEVAAVEWKTLPEIAEQMEQQPDIFTEWFKIYMAEHRAMIGAFQ